MRKTIYVSIVSYRDPLLIKTIESLLQTKSNDNDVIIGVIEQINEEDSLSVKYPHILSNNRLIETTDCGNDIIEYNNSIVYKLFDPKYTQGVGWSRYINQYQISPKSYDFLYQIDSHMLFDEDWDKILLKDYYEAVSETGSDKVIITSPCKSFDIDENGDILEYKNTTEWRGDVKFRNDFNEYGYIFTPVCELSISDGKLHKSIHICAGNTLFPSRWVFDVGNNIESFFDGEEHLLTIKSIINDYALYNMTNVPSYHYNGSGNYVTKTYINPIIHKLTYDRYVDRSREILSDYVNSLSESDLQKYYKYSGVDIIRKTIDESSMTKTEIISLQSTENHWENYDSKE